MDETKDPLELWIEDLDSWIRDCRKDKTSEQNTFVFQQLLPRIKKLATIMLEEGSDETQETSQVVFLKVSTVATLRSALSEYLADPQIYNSFVALESEIEGVDPAEIVERITAAQQRALAMMQVQAKEADKAGVKA